MNYVTQMLTTQWFLAGNVQPHIPVKFTEDVDCFACVQVAKRDIKAGEDLTMCYVDEGGDVATRRAELMDYGFECACERCVREAAGLGQARRGGKTK